MEIDKLSRRVSVQNPSRVQSKAQEFLRLVNIRFPNLGKGEIAKSAICLDLACHTLNEPINRKELLGLSGVPAKVYAHAYDLIRSDLNVENPINVKELCIQFGFSGMVLECEKLAQEFTARYTKELTPAQLQCVDLNRPIFVGIFFYLTCRKMSVRVDKRKILSFAKCHVKEWDRVYKLVYDQCKELVNDVTEKKGGVPTSTVLKSSPAKRPSEALQSIDENFYDRLEKKAKSESQTISTPPVASSTATPISSFPSVSRNLSTPTEPILESLSPIQNAPTSHETSNVEKGNHSVSADNENSTQDYDDWKAMLLAKIQKTKSIAG